MKPAERLKHDAPHVHVTVSQGVQPMYDVFLLGFEGKTLVSAEMEPGVHPLLLAADMLLVVAEIPGLAHVHRVKLVAMASMLDAAHHATGETNNGNPVDVH